MRRLTYGEIKKACRENKYLIVRGNNVEYGLNTRWLLIGRGKCPDSQKTECIGFYPCDINEYISKKLPYGKTNKKQIISKE